jgi:hypothetical protein
LLNPHHFERLAQILRRYVGFLSKPAILYKDEPMGRRGSSKSVDSEELPEKISCAMNVMRSLKVLSEEEEDFVFGERSKSRMIYTNGLTLWLLILQRLKGGETLDEIVSYLLTHGRDLLPNNKRVRENTVSENTGAYSQARKRLPLNLILEICERICNHLGHMGRSIIDGRRVFILDGTTITLPPTPALRKAFPPASNQHGDSVWPVAMLMVANEMESGCALLPQIDAMYGENNVSEAIQAQRIIKQLPANSIVMGDAGFGIFSVAYHVRFAKQDFLFRLSHSRFKALSKQAELFDEGPSHRTYHLLWRPSSKDRRTNPDLPPEASIEVVLHEVEIDAANRLYMVSSLELEAMTASQVYRRRYDVEFDIRDVKVTMDAENIRAKSVDMVLKELYTSIVAYNLVTQFRRQAAEVAKVKPRRLRFKGVWTTFKNRLLMQQPCSLAEWAKRYEIALDHASKKKHPNRIHPRNYPRLAHARRQKSTKFEKLLRRKKSEETVDPPPS